MDDIIIVLFSFSKRIFYSFHVALLLHHSYSILKEVSVLLEALEKRQLELEHENKKLREDLARATNTIEEGDLARKALEEQLAEVTELKSCEEKKDQSE